MVMKKKMNSGVTCVKWRFWCDTAYFCGGLIQDLAFNNRKLDFHLKQGCMGRGKRGKARWLHCDRGHCFCFWAMLHLSSSWHWVATTEVKT